MVRTQTHAVKLSESISCIDHQICSGSLGNINAFRGGRKHISGPCCSLSLIPLDSEPTIFVTKTLKVILCDRVGVCAVSHTCPVFVPGVAGERFKAEAVQRHVRAETGRLLECEGGSADLLPQAGGLYEGGERGDTETERKSFYNRSTASFLHLHEGSTNK